MKQQIIFEIKNGAYYPDQIHRTIAHNIIKTFLSEDIYFSFNTPDNLYTLRMNLFNTIFNALKEFPLDNYYIGENSTGAKVTKIIKKVLLNHFVKELVKKHYPAICKHIAELYSPKMEIKAYWGNKALIGAGEWENDLTCFAENGCNNVSRLFLMGFNRAKVLVLNDEDNKAKVARCIAFFAGGRNIYLTNFYYNKLPQNKLLFIEALKRILSLNKMTYSKAVFPLPIYQNNDGIKCYTNKSSKYKGQIKYPCPHCGCKVKELYTSYYDCTHYIGCSEDCAGGPGGNGRYCERCENNIGDNYYAAPNGDTYCESCYEDNCFCCGSCDEIAWNSQNVGDDLCNNCAAPCNKCGEPTNNDSLLNGNICFDCGIICSNCNETVLNDDVLTNSEDETVCSDCHKDEKENAEKGTIKDTWA